MSRWARVACAGGVVGVIAAGTAVHRLLCFIGETGADIERRRHEDQRWWTSDGRSTRFRQEEPTADVDAP